MIPRTRRVRGCKLCCRESNLTVRARLKRQGGSKEWVPCNRWVFKDNYCIVTVDPTQLSKGHAIAVLWNHSDDITATNLSEEEHHKLINAVQRTACVMKRELKCPMVYVATLCDGVRHLHYHLIPRYETDIRGFAFVGQREFAHANGYCIGPESLIERVKYLEDLARMLRFD